MSKELGIDKNNLKRLIYSSVFGSIARDSQFSTAKNVLKDSDKVKLWRNTGLYKDIRKYYSLVENYIKSRLVDENGDFSNGIITVNLKTNKLTKSQLSAILLQGLESLFIYELIKLCDDNGIKVVSYEFING